MPYRQKKSLFSRLIKRWPMLVVVLLLVSSIVALMLSRHPISKVGDPSPEDIKKSSETDSDKKQQAIDSAVNSEQTPPEVTPKTDSSSLELSASEASGNVTVITKLHGIASGNCTLTVTNGVKSLTKSVIIIYQPEFSTCAGFSIPVSDVGVGNWRIDLVVSGDKDTQYKTLNLEVR